MTTYASVADLRANLHSQYASNPEIADDDDALKLLTEASKLIDEYTLGRAQVAYDSEALFDPEDQLYRATLSMATIKQVEFWLEAGPEHDVAGLRGSVVSGRLQIHPVAPLLSTRAKRELRNGGLYWAGVAVG